MLTPMAPWVHPSYPPKQDLDQFSHFCSIHKLDQKQADHATPSVAIGCYCCDSA